MVSLSNSYISEAEVTNQLQRLETKHDLLRYKLGGWCVWPVLRFSVARAIQNLPLDQGGVGFTKKELLPLAAEDLLRLLWVKRARFAVKTYSSSHMELEEGRKKDVFFDDLLRVTGSYYKIELLNSRSFYLNPAPYLVPRDLSTVALNTIADKLARHRPPAGLAPISAALSECLRRELAIETFTPQVITARLSEFHWVKRLYRMVLRRIGAEYLLLADTGDYPVTAAARELGIKVIEFQHGFTHQHFPGNSWSRYALPYKPSMALPDRIFLYGVHWQRALEFNGFWTEELRVVGSIRVDNYRRQPATRSDRICTLVVTTQGTDTERLVAFLAEFVRLVEGRLSYRLFFKMHPTYHTSNHLFEAAFGGLSSIRLVAASEPPSTFVLLKRAHLHISIYSTCHYEALALGVPTVILPLTGMENVIHLHEAGHAFLPQTPAELVEIAMRWREHCVPEEVGNHYFTRGASENIQRELDSLQSRTT